jgi:hypothetical protein
VTYFQAGHPPTPQKETTMATIPATGNTDNTKPDFVDQLLAIKESQRRRELLDVSHTARLLPPLDEYNSINEYERTLELFKTASATTQVSFYRFNPTMAQRRANADVLARWEVSRRRPRGKPSDDDRRKRALGLLDWRVYSGNGIGYYRAPALAKVQEGERDVQTRDAMRYLAPLVNEGHLTRAELHNAIIEASEINEHIPLNKSRSVVERQIDDAITKFTEPFGWERLDADVH